MEIVHRKGESYQHAAARAVFKKWLEDSNGNFGPFGWHGQVWEEYPLIKGFVHQPLRELACFLNVGMANPPIPTYEELSTAGIYPVAIADIVIDHKGSLAYIIEIVHKHDVSIDKIAKIEAMGMPMAIEIWRVEAHWVLSQVGIPDTFPEACIRSVGSYKAKEVDIEQFLKAAAEIKSRRVNGVDR